MNKITEILEEHHIQEDGLALASKGVFSTNLEGVILTIYKII